MVSDIWQYVTASGVWIYKTYVGYTYPVPPVSTGARLGASVVNIGGVIWMFGGLSYANSMLSATAKSHF